MMTYETELRLDLLWESNFELLIKYKQLYGTINVPNRTSNLDYPEWERKLGRWVATQRKRYNKNELKTWRYEKLVSVGFDFDPFETLFEKHFWNYLSIKKNMDTHSFRKNVKIFLYSVSGYHIVELNVRE